MELSAAVTTVLWELKTFLFIVHINVTVTVTYSTEQTPPPLLL